jgi:hypothetical protein
LRERDPRKILLPGQPSEIAADLFNMVNLLFDNPELNRSRWRLQPGARYSF